MIKAFIKERLIVIKIGRRSKQVPGPGQYQLIQATSKNGNYFFSKFQSSCCRKFGTEKRVTGTVRGSFVSSPGPGSYRAPSEFGYYESKNRNLMEAPKKIIIKREAITAKGDDKKIKIIPEGMSTTRSSSQPTLSPKSARSTLNYKKY